MNKFYFFKVTLNYFGDEQKTFFITPEQSETDDRGVPFSEDGLRNTEEFKEFVKATKADIIDVDYTEFAVEYDHKRSDILNNPVTDDSFAELEKSGALEIVDENQFLILLKKTAGGKKSKGGYLLPLIAAVAFVIGILAGASFKGGSPENSDTSSEVFEVYEVSEDTVESGTESISDEQSSVESIPSTVESSTQSTALSTVSTTTPEPSEAVSSVASSDTSSQSTPAESSEETHEAVTASSDVSE